MGTADSTASVAAGLWQRCVGALGLGVVRGERSLVLVESLTVGAKGTLHLVRCRDAEYLIGGGPAGVQSIVRVGARAQGSVGVAGGGA